MAESPHEVAAAILMIVNTFERGANLLLWMTQLMERWMEGKSVGGVALRTGDSWLDGLRWLQVTGV